MPDPNPNDFKIRLGGKVWRVRFVLSKEIPADRWADCSHPDEQDRGIRIRNSIKGKDRLETILHEALHGIYPDEDEKTISRSGRELAQLLWRCGYRRIEG